MGYYEVVAFKDVTTSKNKATMRFQEYENAEIVANYINNGFKMSDNPSPKEKKLIKAYENRNHNYNKKHGINNAHIFLYYFMEDLADMDSDSD